MKTYEYLYGDYKNAVMEVPNHVIDNRVRLLNRHLKDLSNIHYAERDTTRIKDVCDAINFWKNINNKDRR